MLTTISPDALGIQGPDRQSSIGEAWAQAHRLLREALSSETIQRVIVMVGVPGAGKSTWLRMQPFDPAAVAFDAVQYDRNRRALLAKRIREAGKEAIAVWVVTPLETCIARNNERPEWRAVPVPYLRLCASRLHLQPPTLLEGWTQVLRVLPPPLAGTL